MVSGLNEKSSGGRRWGLRWVGDEDAARAHQPLQKLTMKQWRLSLGGRLHVGSVSIQEGAARSCREGAL